MPMRLFLVLRESCGTVDGPTAGELDGHPGPPASASLTSKTQRALTSLRTDLGTKQPNLPARCLPPAAGYSVPGCHHPTSNARHRPCFSGAEGKVQGHDAHPDPPCSICSGCAPEQQLGSRSLVFKSIKGDRYGDTAATSARAPQDILYGLPHPRTCSLLSRPNSGFAWSLQDALTVVSTAACKRWMAPESFTVISEVRQHRSARSCRQLSQYSTHTSTSTRRQPRAEPCQPVGKLSRRFLSLFVEILNEFP